jgi:sulfur carrier protein ThiS
MMVREGRTAGTVARPSQPVRTLQVPEINKKKPMKVTVECLGLPTLSAVIGKKTDVQVGNGASLSDLVHQITGLFGSKAREVLLDGEGQLDLTIQVMVNDEGFLAREDLPKRELRDGDRVRFMLLVGGG